MKQLLNDSMIQFFNYFIVPLFHCLIVSFLFALPAWAAVGENTPYQIKTVKPEPSAKPTVLGVFTANGFVVQTPTAPLPFSLTISDSTADFGILSPETPVSKTSRLSVSPGSTDYTVLAYENHPLRLKEGRREINDLAEAGLWISNNIYGFGFNVSGDDAAGDFTQSQFYQRFANREAGQSPTAIISSDSISNQPSNLKTFSVNYKINMGLDQEAGRYENSITYLAMPKY